MIVATAGHIDHGKTALVQALTGVDTDRLPEEKKRGISIDLGFAYWTQPGEPTIGFVDVPGHERFIRNMLSGVCAVDCVLLVVAADDGPMPQTVEHLQIVDLLRVDRGVVALTKADKVDDRRLQEVRASTRALLAGTGLADSELVAVSSRTGSGLAVLREQLRAESRMRAHRRRAGHGFRYIVDRVFSVPGSGTVATGVVVAGATSPGARLLVSPAGREVRVRAIQQNGRAVERCQAGERCALNLAGIELAELARGNWVVEPAGHLPTDRFDARLSLLASEAAPLRHGTRLQLHIGAAFANARVGLPRSQPIRPGQSAFAELRLDRAISAVNGERFIVRDQTARRTVGGGTVIDPFAHMPRQSPAERAARRDALALEDPAQALAALLEASPLGVDPAHFAGIYNLSRERLEELLESHAFTVFGQKSSVAMAPARLAELAGGVAAFLTRFHREHAQAPGAESEQLRRQLAKGLDPQVFGQILKHFAAIGAVELNGSRVRLPGHDPTANEQDRKAWELLAPLLRQAGFRLPSVRDLVVATRVPEKPMRAFLHRKCKAGGLILVTPERFAMPHLMASAIQLAKETARDCGGSFTAAQFRDRIGTGRGVAIELLECLDRLGVTVREGDKRRCREEDATLAPSSTGAPGRAQNTEGIRFR